MFGRMQRDDRLVEGRSITGVEGGIPLLVFFPESNDHHVRPLDEPPCAYRVDLCALMVLPEWIGLGAQQVTRIVAGPVVGHGAAQRDRQSGSLHAVSDLATPFRMDFTGEVDGPGHGK